MVKRIQKINGTVARVFFTSFCRQTAPPGPFVDVLEMSRDIVLIKQLPGVRDTGESIRKHENPVSSQKTTPQCPSHRGVVLKLE